MASRRELRDPIHGFIYRDDLEEEIIDTPVFQRLRKIRQLALASLVYPGAVHTRFDHSVGAMHVAGKIAARIDLDATDTRLVRLAALLHDVGHGPFSHVSEPVLEAFFDRETVKLKASEQIHEHLTRAIIARNGSLARLLSERDRERIIGVLSGSYGDTVLKSIVSGPLDADKQDYLMRDSHFCGVQYGVYDLERLSETLTVHQDQDDRYLAVVEDGVHALEQFVLAKYYMTTQVYRHKIRLISDAMIRRALMLGIQVDGVSWLKDLFRYDGSDAYLRNYEGWSDDRVINEMLYGATSEGYAKQMVRSLTDRRLHKRVASYQIIEFTEGLVRNKLTELSAEEKEAIERAIGAYLKCDPRLVIVNTFTIKNVREQARNSEASVLVLRADGPRNFEQISTLFRSIDAAVQEQYFEVYAPVTYADEKEKRKLRTQFQRDFKELLVDFAKKNLSGKEGEGAAS